MSWNISRINEPRWIIVFHDSSPVNVTRVTLDQRIMRKLYYSLRNSSVIIAMKSQDRNELNSNQKFCCTFVTSFTLTRTYISRLRFRLVACDQ